MRTPVTRNHLKTLHLRCDVLCHAGCAAHMHTCEYSRGYSRCSSGGKTLLLLLLPPDSRMSSLTYANFDSAYCRADSSAAGLAVCFGHQKACMFVRCVRVWCGGRQMEKGEAQRTHKSFRETEREMEATQTRVKGRGAATEHTRVPGVCSQQLQRMLQVCHWLAETHTQPC